MSTHAIKQRRRQAANLRGVEPLTDAATITHAYDMVCDIEDNLGAARQLVHAIYMAAQALDDPQASAMQRLAWTIEDRLETTEQQRADLFLWLHPNRAESEKAGWPNEGAQ